MKKYFITKFTVEDLWGHKNYPIELNDDVNVIIGPNASGKTTLINILYDSLSGNFPRLCRTDFREVLISLKAFDGEATRSIRIQRDDEELVFILGRKKYPIPLRPFLRFGDEFEFNDHPAHFSHRNRAIGLDTRELRHELRQLVPAVWLPVSRRLPRACPKSTIVPV